MKLIEIDINNKDIQIFFLEKVPNYERLKLSVLSRYSDFPIHDITPPDWQKIVDRENDLDFCSEYAYVVNGNENPYYIQIKCYHQIEE